MVDIRPGVVEQEPFFTPWLGEEYLKVREAGSASCCVPNWHVMGESHYGGDGDCEPGLTTRVMQDLAIPGYRFFDTVLSIVTETPVEELDRAQAWSRFAFSNFVQDLLCPSARPTLEQWKRGRKAFMGQLAITRPKLLLVVGKLTWDNLPLDGATALPPIRLSDDSGIIDDLWLYSYEHDGAIRHTVATWVYHPSARGRLRPDEARLKVRTVGMNICNIMSAIESHEGKPMLERWTV